MKPVRISKWLWAAIPISIALMPVGALAQSARPGIDANKARVVAFWTAERRAAAIPRDLVVDPRGLGYLRRPDGTLVPYGHRVEAEDGPRVMTPLPFGKPTGGGGGGGGTGGGGTKMVTNAAWSAGGAVQKAAGRLLFEMGESYYVCSGTVATDDGTSGRSIILTAAHCVYDDTGNAFASNVLFIPDQAHSTGKTDFNCGNDPIGCWVPSFGVVDVHWTEHVFPANIPWDYAFYVVNDVGAHSYATYSSTDPSFVAGNSNPDALDDPLWAGSLPLSFGEPKHDVSGSSDFTHALGYSYSKDPKFMYCAEDMSVNGPDNWWLSHCGLSGGSSGGPWVQPMITTSGTGPVISVNSWGYTTGPGMAGPKLFNTSAACVFGNAKGTALTTTAGVAVTCP